MKVLAAALLMCSTLAISAQTEPPAPNRITVTVNTQQTMDPVSKYEYGMFIEHIRDTMYRGLWSELLEDRKFYFPISSAATRAASAAAGRRSSARTSASQVAPSRSRRSNHHG